MHLEVIYHNRLQTRDFKNRRYIYESGKAELTSRMNNEEIPKILKNLEIKYPDENNTRNNLVLSKVRDQGYITEEEISHKRILRAGTRTRFGTVNQIDNYETKVTDYKQLSRMLNYYYGLRGGFNE